MKTLEETKQKVLKLCHLLGILLRKSSVSFYVSGSEPGKEIPLKDRETLQAEYTDQSTLALEKDKELVVHFHIKVF